MAQLTEPLVQDILNGAGCTRWEIEQLCHHWLRTNTPASPVGGFVVEEFTPEWEAGIDSVIHEIGQAQMLYPANQMKGRLDNAMRIARDIKSKQATAQPSAKDGVRGEGIDMKHLADSIVDGLKSLAPVEYGNTFRLRKDIRMIVSTFKQLYTHPATTATGLVDGLPAKWRERAKAVHWAAGGGDDETWNRCADELEAAIGREESGNG